MYEIFSTMVKQWKQIGAKQFSVTPRKWKHDAFNLHNLDHVPSFGSTAVRIELENMAQQVYNYVFPELKVRISSHLEGIRGRAALSLANLASRVLKVSSQPSSWQWNNWWTILPSHMMTCLELENDVLLRKIMHIVSFWQKNIWKHTLNFQTPQDTAVMKTVCFLTRQTLIGHWTQHKRMMVCVSLLSQQSNIFRRPLQGNCSDNKNIKRCRERAESSSLWTKYTQQPTRCK